MDFPRYERYRDSGVEWIGEIPAHWGVQRLKHLSKIRLSNVDKHSKPRETPVGLCNYTDVYYNNFITNGIEFMQATATKEQIEHFSLQKDDVLITKDSESPDDIAVPAYVPHKIDGVLCGYHLSKITPTRINGKYLFYAFQAKPILTQLNIQATGITRFGIGRRDIGNMFLLLPENEEQKKIINFLDEKTTEIDQAISQKQRLIELLKEQKAILINQAVTKGLNPGVAMRDSGVEWIGEIPGHWELTKVKRVFRLVAEAAPRNNDMELLSIYTDIGVKPRRELEERGNKAQTTDGYWIVRKGDFIVNKLLAWMGAIGLSHYDGVTSPAYDILRSTRPISRQYFHSLFRTEIFKSEIKKYSRGIMDMRLRLYFDKLGTIEIPFPPEEEQEKISSYLIKVDSIYEDSQAKIEQEISLISEFKSILISNAVTGKIRIPHEVAP